MDFVRLENIRHFRRLLETEADPERRDIILTLLEKERRKLDASDPSSSDDPDEA